MTAPATYEITRHDCPNRRCPWVTLTFLGSKVDNFRTRAAAIDYIARHPEGPGRRTG